MEQELFFQPYGMTLPYTEGASRVADIDPRLTRTNYFDGRLLTAEDLNRDMLYVDQRLRESGRALGSGVVEGLKTTLLKDSGIVVVEKGIGIAPNGRVLEIKKALKINLANRALIAELNGGKFQHFNRGLYAVVLRYAELGQGIAEVFPTDLGDQKSISYDQIAEGVELNLVPIPYPMPLNTTELSVRAILIKEMLGAGMQSGITPEDSVPLGVLAIANDKPLWLDEELLRYPVRNHVAPGDMQSDLLRMYQHLYKDITEHRNGSGLGSAFAATEYFHLMPPIGALPKENIDPVKGTQTFFPEHYSVEVAPVRKEDLPLLRKESLQLAPISPADKAPVEVVVLAPLGPERFAYYAQKLELEYRERYIFPSNLLSLRLYARPKPHRVDTDAGFWQQLWDELDVSDLIFLRKPLRAAESGVSTIMLARGFEAKELLPQEEPSPATDTGGDTAGDTGGTGGGTDAPAPVINEAEIFLKRVNFEQLISLRPPQLDEVIKAVSEFIATYGKDDTLVLRCMKVLLLVERHYNDPIWMILIELANRARAAKSQTLLKPAADTLTKAITDLAAAKEIAAADRIVTATDTLTDAPTTQLLTIEDPFTEFTSLLIEYQAGGTTGKAVAKLLEQMQMDATIIENWAKFAETGP